MAQGGRNHFMFQMFASQRLLLCMAKKMLICLYRKTIKHAGGRFPQQHLGTLKPNVFAGRYECCTRGEDMNALNNDHSSRCHA